ncbi:MAG: polymer-forming cytoskeletal protein [Deltaproteobacteria bacterium]|nr:polymer-forming cytoskeletal protein [Deltaproteobacteria bacterium]MCB2186326.1 polymer-forming cytoskeletal protein [Deltaproteobacteria bacterium]
MFGKKPPARGSHANSPTVLASGSFIKGDLVCQGELVLEGGVEGQVVGDKVLVKSTGWVNGQLVCRSIRIEQGGIINGPVRVAELAETEGQP